MLIHCKVPEQFWLEVEKWILERAFTLLSRKIMPGELEYNFVLSNMILASEKIIFNAQRGAKYVQGDGEYVSFGEMQGLPEKEDQAF